MMMNSHQVARDGRLVVARGVLTGVRETVQDSWRVRILNAGGSPVGAGVLLSDGRVLSCAHVVRMALEPDDDGDPQSRPVLLDFPGSVEGKRCTAEVLRGGWAPQLLDERGDIAVLGLLDSPPGDVRPAPLHRCGPTRKRPVRAFGQPARAESGTWATAALRGAGGRSPDWIQLDAPPPPSEQIAKGFSGAGVVDEDNGTVIGIVVAVANGSPHGIAWMIPVEAAVRYAPLLADAVAPGSPPAPGFSWPVESERRLTDALLKLRSIYDPGIRQDIVRDTGPDIAMLASRSSIPLQDVRGVVHMCLQYTDGVDRLLAAVRWYERGSVQLAALERVWLELRSDGDAHD